MTTKHIYAVASNDPYDNEFDLVRLNVCQTSEELIECVTEEIKDHYESDFEEGEENEELNEVIAEINAFVSDSAADDWISVYYTDISFKIVRKEVKLRDA